MQISIMLDLNTFLLREEMRDDVEYIVHIINYSIFNTAVKQYLDTYINLLGYTKSRYIKHYYILLDFN